MNGDWRDSAACRGVGPDMFFIGGFDDSGEPIHGETKEEIELRRKAEATCAGCPVSVDCAEYAVGNERFGMWAGLSARQLKRRRSQQLTPA